MPKRNEIKLLPCDCIGICSILAFDFSDWEKDGYVIITHYVDLYDQPTIARTIISRIKAAIAILRGRTYPLGDVVVYHENFTEFVKELTERIRDEKRI